MGLLVGGLVLVIRHPVDAAGVVGEAFGGIGRASDSVATFIASLR
ncbi:hypothetical protein [Amycolatopsis sp. NPDC051102]